MEPDIDDYRRDDRAMMRASLESLDEKYWSDEDEPSSSTSHHQPSSSSSSSSTSTVQVEEVEDSTALDNWNELSDALHDPNGSLSERHAANLRVCVLTNDGS